MMTGLTIEAERLRSGRWSLQIEDYPNGPIGVVIDRRHKGPSVSRLVAMLEMMSREDTNND